MPETYSIDRDNLFKKYNLTERDIGGKEEIQKIVTKNLQYLMVKYKTNNQVSMPRKDLAELLEIGAPQLTKILQGEQMPSLFPCLHNATKVFGYTIDELLYEDIERTDTLKYGANDDLPVAAYMKFTGLYQLYYFDTSSFKGREFTENGDAIKSGIMYVVDNNDNNNYTVYAIFNMKKKTADDFFRNALKEGRETASLIRDKILSYSHSQHVYFGELNLSKSHVYVNLRFENVKDRVQMIFHRPDSCKMQYIGGLGTVVSVSKGRNASPCVGYIAISNRSLDVSTEELASQLLMHYPNIKTHGSLDDAIDLAVDLFTTPDYSRLDDHHKRELIEKEVDRVVNETIERNLFRTAVISPVDDDEFYHYLKKVR